MHLIGYPWVCSARSSVIGSRGIEEAALDIALFVDILAENESLDACENFSDFRICGIWLSHVAFATVV